MLKTPPHTFEHLIGELGQNGVDLRRCAKLPHCILSIYGTFWIRIGGLVYVCARNFIGAAGRSAAARGPGAGVFDAGRITVIPASQRPATRQAALARAA